MKLYMVGDSPESDIKGGRMSEYETYLVKTGNYKDGQPTENAHHVVEDVYDAVEHIIKNHYDH